MTIHHDTQCRWSRCNQGGIGVWHDRTSPPSMTLHACSLHHVAACSTQGQVGTGSQAFGMPAQTLRESEGANIMHIWSALHGYERNFRTLERQRAAGRNSLSVAVSED
jgi:hypothetical protein